MDKPTNKWGFRTNWRGKVILQRQWTSSYYETLPYWKDTQVSDLTDYYGSAQLIAQDRVSTVTPLRPR